MIYTLSVILKKRQSLFARLAAKEHDVLSLLVDLSEDGFKSALTLLHDLGFSDADIIKIRLRSLPLVDRHARDKVVSMREAVEEIRLSGTYSGPRGIRQDHYALGHDGKHGIQLFRIDKNLFSLRSRKIK